MLTIDRGSAFKRDLKRELKGQHKAYVVAELKVILDLLVASKPIPAKHRDHALTNTIFRDLHVRSDLVLIYRTDKTTLFLERLGSHSEVF